MSREMSETMRELLREKARVDGMRDHVLQREKETREAYRAASEAEGEAGRQYSRVAAKFRLLSKYKTVKEKEWAALADDDLDDLQGALDACVTLRREMKAAHESALKECSLVEAQYECLTAAYHAYNRELKVELDLAGRTT
jgi:hypothetical protein